MNSDAHSLVLAKWKGVQADRPDPACDAPNIICLDARADVRFGGAQTLTGPDVPRAFVALVVFHSSPFPESDVLLSVDTLPDGSRRAKVLDIVRDEENEACISADAVNRYKLIVPSYAYRENDGFCFAVV